MGAPFEPTHLIGCDIETTGTDRSRDLILEVAVLVADVDSLVEVERFSSVVQPPFPWKTEIDASSCDPYVRKMHHDSGLWSALEAGEGVTMVQIETVLLEIFARYPKGMLFGRNVGTFDREFLERKLPGVTRGLHYRVLDLSTLLTFVKLYQPALRAELDEAKKDEAHRALADIIEDFATLRRIIGPR